MTLPSFLVQIGELLVIGLLALLALRLMNGRPPPGVRRTPPDRPPPAQAPRRDPPPQTAVLVTESWTPGQCAGVLEALMPGQEFQFFAADYPSPTDPGGYVRVQRSLTGALIRKVANQGWSSFWERRELEELRDELYRNRAAQTVTVNRAVLTAAYRQEAEGNR